MRPLGVEQATEEGGGGAHLVLGVEPFQREDHGDAVLAHPRGDALQLHVVAVRLDHDVAVTLGQGHEVALGIDHRLLDQPGALLQQPAQEVRLAGAGVALHEEAGGEQLDEVERADRLAGEPQVDRETHAAPSIDATLPHRRWSVRRRPRPSTS